MTAAQSASAGVRHLRVAGDGFRKAYEGTDEGYDPDGFYVRATNKHDHRAETRVAMPPDLYNAITSMISQGELAGTPITNYQSFMRDAAVHNLHRLGRIRHAPSLLELGQRQRQLARIEQAAEEAQGLAKVVGEADEHVSAAMRAGDLHHVLELVALYEGMIESMREPYCIDLEQVLRDARRWLRGRAS